MAYLQQFAYLESAVKTLMFGIRPQYPPARPTTAQAEHILDCAQVRVFYMKKKKKGGRRLSGVCAFLDCPRREAKKKKSNAKEKELFSVFGSECQTEITKQNIRFFKSKSQNRTVPGTVPGCSLNAKNYKYCLP